MEKQQLIKFIATVMEKSDFKVYPNFKTSKKIIDIYGVLPSLLGDFSVVVSVKNYDKNFEIGINHLKEMEFISQGIKASKTVIITSSKFSKQATNYGLKKNIKLMDRKDLNILAQKYKKKNGENTENNNKNLNTIHSQSPYNKTDDLINNDYINNFPINTGKSGPYENDNYQENEYLDNYFQREIVTNKKNSNLSRSLLKNNEGELNIKPKSNILEKRAIKPPKKKTPWGKIIENILNNIIVLIIIVVGISYFVSYGLESINVISKQISGLIKILLSLLLSYGLVFTFNKKGSDILVKGTIVFFVSLFVLILLIILL